MNLALSIKFALSVSVWHANANDDAFFIAFGDYGEDRAEFRKLVGELRGKAYSRVQFVALLGDCFYPKGVKSVKDPQFSIFKKFEFVAPNFYPVLGNHDYGYTESPAAMIEYSKVNPRWKMPAKYYMERRRLVEESVSSGELCMYFIDTHVFEKAQQNWLESSLATCQGNDKYRIIFGHYPVMSVGIYAHSGTTKRTYSLLIPMMKKFKVDAYISGHEHQMQAFVHEGVHFIISGASSQLNRDKKGDRSVWQNELRFVDDVNPGFLAFYIQDEGSGLKYSFIQAGTGKALYSASLRSLNIPNIRNDIVRSTQIPIDMVHFSQTYTYMESTGEAILAATLSYSNIQNERDKIKTTERPIDMLQYTASNQFNGESKTSQINDNYQQHEEYKPSSVLDDDGVRSNNTVKEATSFSLSSAAWAISAACPLIVSLVLQIISQ